MKISHIVNITQIDESKYKSYLHIAQPLTLKSMLQAKTSTTDDIDVELYSIKNKGENIRPPVGFIESEDIPKYAYEYIPSLKGVSKKPLPRLVDILNGLYTMSEADYFIYTNLDITLMPEFYNRVKELIVKGYDAIYINREDLPYEYDNQTLNEQTLELCYQTPGTPHIGIDCFIFQRKIVPRLKLRNAFIGFPPIGQLLKTEIDKYSANPIWIKNERLTFHIGSDESWRAGGPYFEANHKQSKGFVNQFSQKKPNLCQRFILKLKHFSKRKLIASKS